MTTTSNDARRATAVRVAKRVLALLAFLMLGLVVWFYVQMGRSAREQAGYVAQRNGLLSLDSVQAAYFAQDRDRDGRPDSMYAKHVGELPTLDLKPGVEVQITYSSNTGWAARSSHVHSDYICALFVGVVPNIPMTIRDHVVDTPGIIYCENHGIMPTRR